MFKLYIYPNGALPAVPGVAVPQLGLSGNYGAGRVQSRGCQSSRR